LGWGKQGVLRRRNGAAAPRSTKTALAVLPAVFLLFCDAQKKPDRNPFIYLFFFPCSPYLLLLCVCVGGFVLARLELRIRKDRERFRRAVRRTCDNEQQIDRDTRKMLEPTNFCFLFFVFLF
jgi:hypothetical protein